MSENLETTTNAAGEQKLRQEKVGRVLSAGMNKTIVVEVLRRVPHPLYRREVQISKKFYAHDEKNQCRVGDLVRIVESRPLSRLKRWRLAEVVRASKTAGLVTPAEIDDTTGATDGRQPTPGTGTEG